MLVAAAMCAVVRGEWSVASVGGSDAAGDGLAPWPRWSSAGVLCEGLDVLLFAGGQRSESTAMDDAWLWNVSAASWLGPFPGPGQRAGHALVVLRDTPDACDVLALGGLQRRDEALRDNVYVVGRLRKRVYSDGDILEEDDVTMYDEGNSTSTKYNEEEEEEDDDADQDTGNIVAGLQMTWTEGLVTLDSDGPGNRVNFAFVNADAGEVFLLGGNPDKALSHDVVWKLALNLESLDAAGAEVSPLNGTWEVISDPNDPNSPPSLWAHSAVKMEDDYIVFYGGYMYANRDGGKVVTSKDMYIFSISRQEFSIPVYDRGGEDFLRHGHVMAAFGSSLYLHGGSRIYFQTEAANSPRFFHFFSSLLQTSPLSSNPRSRCTDEDDLEDLENRDLFCRPSSISEESPGCRAFHTGVQRKDFLFVFGGLGDTHCSQRGVNNDMWKLNMTSVEGMRLLVATEELNFDLTALISSVYFFFGLLTITICLFFLQFLRRRHQLEMRSNYFTAAPSSQGRERGASLTSIRKLEKIKFDPEVHAQEEACPICLYDYEPGDDMISLPCTHLFHTKCCEAWLIKNDSCPLCKRSIRNSSSEISHQEPQEEIEEQPQETRDNESSSVLILITS